MSPRLPKRTVCRCIRDGTRLDGDSSKVSKAHPIFGVINFAVNTVVLAAFLMTVMGIGWEYSTVVYLKGFSDAVIPYTSSPEDKVNAILKWMEHGAARRTESSDYEPQYRDPEDTLNYQELLRVCGTATNAFVNLGSSGGLKTRRLLLLDSEGLRTNHVVAEVWLGERWIVADPSFHTVLRDDNGQLLSREQLSIPSVFNHAVRDVKGYDLAYNYENTTHLHVTALPYIGRSVVRFLNFVFPQWDNPNVINWTLLLERQSYAVLVTGMVLLLLGILLRGVVNWYGRTRLSERPIGLWEQAKHAGFALLALPSLKVP